MNPNQLKNLFYGLLLAAVAIVGLSAWLAVRAIGGIEVIQAASDDLELRRFRIAAKLRTQVHRLSASMLRYQVTGDAAFRDRFEQNREQLESFIEENRKLLDTAEEKTTLKEIEEGLAEYFEDAHALMEGRDRRERAELSVERIERIKGELDAIIELANELGDARKDAFRKLLADYRLSARVLQRSIFGVLVVLAIVLAGLSWLGYRVFFAPLRGELQAAKDLANVGILASGIAHEIRNPLTAMKARAFALKALVDDPKALRQAEVIEGEIDRLERVVRGVLDFARPAELDRQVVKLDAYLKEIHELVEPEMSAKAIGFKCSIDEAFEVRIDPAQMKQVILNLLRNAGEACPESGSEVELGGRCVNGRIIIYVRDNGAGIPEEYQAKLFEPFYSKKPAGTGLGLSIARNIVRKHGGELSFETKDTKGTTFTITLPDHPEI